MVLNLGHFRALGPFRESSFPEAHAPYLPSTTHLQLFLRTSPQLSTWHHREPIHSRKVSPIIYALSLLLPNSRGISPLSAISLRTFSAVFIASTPAGTPQYVVACMMASRISSSDKPLFLAPRICTASSGARLSAISIPVYISLLGTTSIPSIPILIRLLCCFVRPGLVHAYPTVHLSVWTDRCLLG